ncbi:hypothetical protein MTR67_003555 [Solanum verrucosum]|uniref:Tf2-1-like SH3-like domain-containing protein n=1 Tax=Solanum verrucosum TaxID=315347 RepID=A0AAF0PVU1_SOLVR|nr:hypothetical protein MTR67_003555 [Solanum verrucosum]
MTPFKGLLGRGCRLSIRWFEAGNAKSLGVDLVREALENVRVIQTKLLVAQSIQNKYTYHKVKYMIFQDGEQVLLKVSPMKGVMRFGKKGKMSPWCIDPFEVLESVGLIAYKLEFPHNLSGMVEILDRDVRKLRTKEIRFVKV